MQNTSSVPRDPRDFFARNARHFHEWKGAKVSLDIRESNVD